MSGKENFDTCQFRSVELIRIGDKPCCSDNRYDGYVCYERRIEGLTPVKCEGCKAYRKKRILKHVGGDDPFNYEREENSQ
jgi:hypothetical protein